MKPVNFSLASCLLSLSFVLTGFIRAEDPPAKTPAAAEKKADADKKPDGEKKSDPEKKTEAGKKSESDQKPAADKKTDASADAKPSDDGVPMKATKPADATADKKPADKKTDAKDAKTEKKPAPAPAAGGLLNMVGRMVGNPGLGQKAPTTPQEAVETGFRMIRQQQFGVVLSGSPATANAEKKDDDKKETEKTVDPFDVEQKRWVDSITAVAPLDKFKALPAQRQQEIIQTIQNGMWMVRNQRGGAGTVQLSSQDLRDASREMVALNIKRFMALPLIQPEPRAEIEKQFETFVDLMQEKAKAIYPQFLKNETIRTTFRSMALSNFKSQMGMSNTLTFKSPIPQADIDSAKKQFDQDQRNFEQNRNIYQQNLYMNSGLPNNFDKLSTEEQDKAVTRNAPRIGNMLYYNTYIFNQFQNNLATASQRAATKARGAIDLTGGVPEQEMKAAQRKQNRFQQREWRSPATNQWGVTGKTTDEFADNVIKQLSTQYGSRIGIVRVSTDGKLPELPKEQQKALDEARDAMKRILHGEISNEDFAKLDATRRNGIAGHLINLGQQLMNYGRMEVTKEQAAVATKSAQLEVRKEVRIPVIPVEGRDITEKQVEKIIDRLVDLAAKKEPDLFISDSVRESFRDALQNTFDNYLSNTRDAAFKMPLSDERFQQLLSQLDTKFRVYWTKNNRINLIQPAEQARFKAMSKADKIQYLDEQNRAMNIGWNLQFLGNEVLQSVKLDYEMYARATKFSKVDFSGGVSKDQELEVHNLQAKMYQANQERAAANVKKLDRSAEEAGKVRSSAAAALLKPGLLGEEAQHRRFMFFLNSSIGAAIVLLVLLLFKLRANRLKNSASSS